jgi:uncharacterized membrane protein YccC
MSNLSLARTAGVGAGDRLTKSGDGPPTHQPAVGVTFSVLAWLCPIATAAAARVRRLTRQALRKIVGRSRTKSGSTPGSARLGDLKARERIGRFAVAMRRCVSALEPGRFVLRCSLAASVAYGLATLVGFQHPVWAPIEALIVSQESIGETFDSIQDRLVGTLIGVAVALLVGIFGRTIGLPLILQIAISVTVCAVATSRRPTIRVCLWTCPLVLVMAPSLGTPELVGVIRVSQVLLGAIVGGVTHVLDQKVWDDWNNLSAREDTYSAELSPSKPGVSELGTSRLRSQVR